MPRSGVFCFGSVVFSCSDSRETSCWHSPPRSSPWPLPLDSVPRPGHRSHHPRLCRVSRIGCSTCSALRFPVIPRCSVFEALFGVADFSAGFPSHHFPVLANLRHRSIARRKLGARSDARCGDQRSRTNSPIINVYSGPTLRKSPCAGAKPSRIALLRERREIATRRDFGSCSCSGAAGIAPFATQRK